MRDVGSDPQCNNLQRGDCGGSDHEQEKQENNGFTAEELPYRQTVKIPDEVHFYPRVFFGFFLVVRKVDQGNGVSDEGFVCKKSDRKSHDGVGVAVLCSGCVSPWRSSDLSIPAAAKRGRRVSSGPKIV